VICIKVNEEDDQQRKYFYATVVSSTPKGLWVKINSGPFGNKILLTRSHSSKMNIIPPNLVRDLMRKVEQGRVFNTPSPLKVLACLKPTVVSLDADPVYKQDWWVIGGWALVILILAAFLAVG